MMLITENVAHTEDLYESSSSSSESSVSLGEFPVEAALIDGVLSNNVFLTISQVLTTRGV